MADRQTKRERKEEARKARLEAQRRAARRRRLQRLWSLVILAAVIAGIVFVVNLTKKDEKAAEAAVNKLATAAKCDPLEKPTNEGATHISPPERAQYGSQPPTSGPHYNAGGIGPIATGVTVNPVQAEGYVHNLEHGHTALLHKPDAPEAARKVLDELAQEDNRFVISAPYEQLEDPVAILAWDHRITCDGTGTDQAMRALVEAFKDEYKNGPEGHRPGAPAN